MSAFTQWNGPAAGHGPSTKDVLALIDAYNNMNALLSKHIESTSTDDVHKFNTALQEAITELNNTLSAAIALKEDKTTVSSLSETVASNTSAIQVETSRAQSAEQELTNAITSETERATNAEILLNDMIVALEGSVETFKNLFDQRAGSLSFDGDETTTITGILEVTDQLIGKVKVRKLVDYVEWETLSAQFAGIGSAESGTKSNGIYVLGRLSEEWDPDKGFTDTGKQKAARVYIKYINDRPFDLVVDLTATGVEKGKITCTASFNKEWTEEDPDDAWEDMALHLISNTDSSGSKHVYLGISARGLSGQSTTFHVAGENFIAGGTINGISSRIGFTNIAPGFNAYRANFDDLRVSAVNDSFGGNILEVTTYKGENFTATKTLYVADSSFTNVYFKKRPSVIFAEKDEEENDVTYIAPVLTAYDLDALTTDSAMKGVIVFWPQWEEVEVAGNSVKRAINIPDNWIACDGSTISTAEYPTLIEILNLPVGTESATLPCMDYAIMRLKGLFDDVELPDSEVTTSMTTLELTEAVNSLQDSLTQEISDRQEGDATNTSLINTEATTREEADTQLQANIDAEATARQEADTQIQTNIDTEATSRQEADTTLQANIDTEATSRQEADTTLQANIDAEATARQEADTQLQADVETFKTDMTQEMSDFKDTVEQALEEETVNRQNADTTLQAAIDAEITARREADTALQSAIDTEIDARREADAALQAQIDTETAGRIAVDDALEEAIQDLDESKAETWQGTAEEFEEVKDSLKDGTIVLSPDELEEDTEDQ